MMTYDSSNKMFQLALDLVNQSSRNIFLTGKAGTGKTTFLKYIRENCAKQMAVVAPTGVAAINAGGVTIHSFFQLSFAPFLPETGKFSSQNEDTIDRHGLLSRLRLTKEKLKVLQQLELLIIDEVSMVRCDTMDAIDAVLRHTRNKPFERFGGVQVLFIGDMFQLPPVIRDPEWKLLSEFYTSPYFFDSFVLREELPVYIEFTKIYRQSEERFISVLNQVRNNELDEDGMHILESRFQPSFPREKEDGYIVLTTHNEKARDINSRELQHLTETATPYKAEIKGDFPENAYPADEVIYLKPGAQVMFIKNDSDKAKRYFNGKIGVIKKLETDKITVETKDQGNIEVVTETWKNIRYTVNKASRAMDEEELGSFTQFPLRLAWAITIHKSQGLTFEKAIIDAGAAFAAGQVYVALSRCTNLEGMVLQSRIRPHSLTTDNRITAFAQSCIQPDALEDELVVARRNYHINLMIAAFDFSTAVNAAVELKEYIIVTGSSFNDDAEAWAGALSDRLTALQATAEKFHTWLRAQGQQTLVPEENTLLQIKLRDGAAHFVKEIQPAIDMLYQSPVVTDSRQHAKEFNDLAKEVFAELYMKLFLLKGFDGRFDAESWHRKKRNFVVPPVSINAYAGVSTQKPKGPHAVLYDRLKKLRDAICAKKDLPIYLIASSKTLDEMVNYLPQTEDELEQITGFGKVKVEKYGQQFLDIILEYSKENDLSSRISEKAVAPKKEKKVTAKKEKPVKIDTKAESFRLFKEGLTIADIAKTRGFTAQTIEGHLTHYIKQGDIHIEEVVAPGKLSLIEPALKDFAEGESIVPVKDRLGETISFGEIRMVLAWKVFHNKQDQP